MFDATATFDAIDILAKNFTSSVRYSALMRLHRYQQTDLAT